MDLPHLIHLSNAGVNALKNNLWEHHLQIPYLTHLGVVRVNGFFVVAGDEMDLMACGRDREVGAAERLHVRRKTVAPPVPGVAAIAFAERADGLLHRSLLGRVPAGKRGREGEKKGRRGEEEMKGEEEKKKR